MHGPKPNRHRWFAVAAINVVLFLLLLEGFALLGSFLETGRFFYGAERTVTLVPTYEMPALDSSLLFRLHPYFGYVIRPGKTWTPGLEAGGPAPNANNLGFNSPIDYPVARSDSRQFFVAILGGSVAANYATFERMREDGGGLRGLPALAGREVVVLNFAVGGYKQPQQLAVLGYFLATGQPIDLAINIDGFNELAISRLNESRGYAFAMPNADQIAPLVDLASGRWDSPRVEGLARIAGARRRIAEHARARSRCTFAVCDQWYRLRIRRAEDELARGTRAAGERSEGGEPVLLLQPAGEPEADFDHIADLWVSASSAMHDLARGRGIPYLHVLQPNQYAPHQRRFTAAERRVALDEDGPYTAAARAGYPYLIRAVPRLREHGVAIEAPLDLFDQFAPQAYRDSCCHFTVEGNRRLSDLVARNVGAMLSAPPAVNPRRSTP